MSVYVPMHMDYMPHRHEHICALLCQLLAHFCSECKKQQQVHLPEGGHGDGCGEGEEGAKRQGDGPAGLSAQPLRLLAELQQDSYKKQS